MFLEFKNQSSQSIQRLLFLPYILFNSKINVPIFSQFTFFNIFVLSMIALGSITLFGCYPTHTNVLLPYFHGHLSFLLPINFIFISVHAVAERNARLTRML